MYTKNDAVSNYMFKLNNKLTIKTQGMNYIQR